jgi:hypothetical protein
MAQPMLNLGGNLSPEQQIEQQQIARQQRMAELLMQQSQQTPQGQMVSGRYVAPNFFQYAAPLLQGYLGKKELGKVEDRQLDMAKRLREQGKLETQRLMNLIGGQPAQPAPAGYELIDAGTPAIEANPRLALAEALNMESPQARALLPQIATEAFKKPEAFTLSADQSRFVTMPDGTSKEIAKGIPKPPAPTTDMQNFLFAKERGEIPQNMGFLGYQKYVKQLSKDTDTQDNMSMVNNNGMPVGRFDKTGRYISPQGRVFPASAVTEAQKEHDVTMDLTNKLNNLTKGDIKNAFGSVMDYTGSKVGQMVGRKDVVDAQNKINSIQIKNVLDNLSQLKGASSDKEMAQMIKDFPAYTADPEIMEKWTDRAAKTANRFLKRSEQRYGFDTEYAQEDRFTGNKEKDQPINKLSTQDQEALNWANANPKDPRSAQIKSRLNK